MYDMKALVKIIAAIKALEGGDVLNMALFDKETLGITLIERDMHIIRLVRAGYVDGIKLAQSNSEIYPHIEWRKSAPMLTIEGIAFITENASFRKAVEELKEVTKWEQAHNSPTTAKQCCLS